jgi:hypothetical protein
MQTEGLPEHVVLGLVTLLVQVVAIPSAALDGKRRTPLPPVISLRELPSVVNPRPLPPRLVRDHGLDELRQKDE